MQYYKDSRDSLWAIEFDCAKMKGIKKEFGADPLDVENFYNNKLKDILFVCDLLYFLCKDQMNKNNVGNPEEFAKGLTGDVLAEAMEILISEYINFFPNQQVREALKAIRKSERETSNLLLQKVQEEALKADPNAEAERLLEKIKFIQGKNSGD
jgi:hypothetical protein